MPMHDEIMPRLLRKYVELSATCYRAATAARKPDGRFRRGHRKIGPPPAVLKKIDLDEALERVYQRFFGPYAVESGNATPTSNSRRQGSDT